MNVQEFSSKIKSKYPQYADMDDNDLAKRMIAKYPQYADIVSFEPQTLAGEAVQGLKYGVTYPLGLPVNPFSPYKAGREFSEAKTVPEYFSALMPDLERKVSAAKARGTEIIGDYLRDTPTRFPVTRGLVAGAIDVAGTMMPVEPSSAVGLHAILPNMRSVATHVTPELPVPPRLAKDLPGAMQKILDDFQVKYGRKPTQEETGRLLKGNFESGFAPKQFEAETSLQTEKATAQKKYETALYEEKLQNERAKFEAEQMNIENQRKYEAEQIAKKESFSKTAQVPLAKLGGEAIDTQTVGRQVSKDIGDKLSAKRVKSNELYEQLGEKMGDSKPVKGTLDKPIQAISTIFEQQGINAPKTPDLIANQLIKKTVMQEFDLTSVQADAMLETAKGINSGRLTSASVGQETLNAYKFMNDVSGKLSNPDLTNRDLALMRTDVGRFAYSGTDTAIKSVYKKLYHSLTEVIDKNAEAGGFSKISKGARDFYKGFKDFQESDVVKALDSKDPSELLKFATKTPETTARLMEHLTPETKSAFQRGHLTEILKPDAQGVVQAKDVARRLNSASPEKIKAIYGEKADMVNAFKKYADIVDKSEGFKPEPIPAAVSSRLDVPVLRESAEKIASKKLNMRDMEAAEVIRNTEPSKVVQKVMSDKSIDNLKSILRNTDETGQKALQGGVWDEIRRTSLDTEGNLDMGKLSSNIDKISSKSPEFFKVLYGEDSKIVESTQKVAAYIQENVKDSLTNELTKAVASWSWRMKGYHVMKAILPRFRAGKDISEILQKTNAPESVRKTLFPVPKK